MTKTILHIDASARTSNSTSRELSALAVNRLNADTVIRRDLTIALPQIDESWVNANFTPLADRTEDQKAKLALSDQLVDEIMVADTLVFGLPIYNFSVPASLKAWIDLIARAGRTFEYTAEGPRGLLTGKRAIIAVASGGTQVGSDIDFATGYLTHIMGFIGITDVQIVAADRLAIEPDATIAAARNAVETLAA